MNIKKGVNSFKNQLQIFMRLQIYVFRLFTEKILQDKIGFIQFNW